MYLSETNVGTTATQADKATQQYVAKELQQSNKINYMQILIVSAITFFITRFI
jgi:hypothetical protein